MAIVRQASIATYGESRNLSDRSKLWLTLQAANYPVGHLRAVGKHGVNRSVVDALAPAIASSDLISQRELVDALTAADFSDDAAARTAATNLALELLNSDLKGAGPHAARIAIASNGAGSQAEATPSESVRLVYGGSPFDDPQRESPDLG